MFVLHVLLEIVSPFSTTIIAVWFTAAVFFIPMNGRFVTASTCATRKGLVATEVSALKLWTALSHISLQKSKALDEGSMGEWRIAGNIHRLVTDASGWM
ncbi:hypothetical protein BPOR_1372g00020 [Botrytis porri]|uniref:Uncharacterized protein n=1 Tax=Botrytis porri TaxID=87229 RepID=A0A4Z1K6E1_9HELO|nr:hypothetical protein BPOR_1372g00020 [Botrytis porri]